MPDLKLGAKLWYVPHLDHAYDDVVEGGRIVGKVYDWVHVETRGNPGLSVTAAGPVRDVLAVKAGDPVDWNRIGDRKAVAREPADLDFSRGGRLRSQHGHLMRPDKPRSFWPAAVVANLRAYRVRLLEAVRGKSPLLAEASQGMAVAALEELCSQLDLAVAADPSDGFLIEWVHPNGCQTGCYPLQGHGAVTFDPEKKTPHSYHFAEG